MHRGIKGRRGVIGNSKRRGGGLYKNEKNGPEKKNTHKKNTTPRRRGTEMKKKTRWESRKFSKTGPVVQKKKEKLTGKKTPWATRESGGGGVLEGTLNSPSGKRMDGKKKNSQRRFKKQHERIEKAT